MKKGQCNYCGAPTRQEGTPCAFCGTLTPAPVVEPPGMAQCVCSVLASWRCLACDTPVCGQHRNTFWPGQGVANIGLVDPAERTVWSDATKMPAALINAGASEACTVCRAEIADQSLQRFRSLPHPLPTNALNRMLLLADNGFVSASFFEGAESAEFLRGLISHLRATGETPKLVAEKWKMRAGQVRGRPTYVEAWMLPMNRSGLVLVVRSDQFQVCGPVKVLAQGQDRFLAAGTENPDQDVYRDGFTGTTIANNGSYLLRWRRPGPSPRDLGAASYLELLVSHLSGAANTDNAAR